MSIHKPNCSTCDKKHELDSCPMFSSPYYMGIGGYTQFLSDIVERNGCFHHPGAREYLMKDVIQELERRSRITSTHRCTVWVLAVYDEAIALIRDGVK